MAARVPNDTQAGRPWPAADAPADDTQARREPRREAIAADALAETAQRIRAHATALRPVSVAAAPRSGTGRVAQRAADDAATEPAPPLADTMPTHAWTGTSAGVQAALADRRMPRRTDADDEFAAVAAVGVDKPGAHQPASREPARPEGVAHATEAATDLLRIPVPPVKPIRSDPAVEPAARRRHGRGLMLALFVAAVAGACGLALLVLLLQDRSSAGGEPQDPNGSARRHTEESR
jgi:hypothetical protein